MSILFIFGFRPLPGSFLFHHDRNNYHINYMWVSVPCRGLFYFILYRCYIHRCSRNCFRPLPGAFLFHRLKQIKNGLTTQCFRPLPGSFLFHHLYVFGISSPAFWVSVPCRGLFYFINATFKIADELLTSFRPLPGSFLFHQRYL